MTALLPEGAAITKRGGKGHEFWGHPNEPTAQYNHLGRQSHRPPIVPWRLEVKSPGNSLHECFLHVIEIGEQSQKSASRVSLLDRGIYQGAGLEEAGTPVEVLFATEGNLTARVKIGDEKEKVLKPGVITGSIK